MRKTPATATFFTFMEAAGAGQSSSEGEHVRAYDIQAAIVPRTTCVSDLQPGATPTRTEGDVVLMCDQVQVTTMRFSPTGRHYRRRRGIGRSARCDQVELPRIARPKGCCDICDIRSFGEQSRRTTGRLGSTGLLAMPSEGQHSRHSGASTAAIAAGPRQ